MKLTIREIADLKEGRKTLSEIQYYKSYFHKPHLGNLPHDLHTNDISKLKERLDACRDAQKKDEDELKKIDDIIELNEMEVEASEHSIDKLSQENKELLAQNKQIDDTINKVYNHFEDVTMLTEDDGWEIKKAFDEVMSHEEWVNDLSEIDSVDKYEMKVEEEMKYFVDDISLKGYLTFKQIDHIKQLKKDLNNTFEEIVNRNSDEYSGPPSELEYLEDNIRTVQNRLDDYLEKYDLSNDTPLTRELNKIESDGNLSDKWYEIQGANEKKIKQNTEKIEKTQNYIGELEQSIKNKNRERGKVSTRIKDYQEHEAKIRSKIADLED